jgi:hypothetical protein
LAFIKTPKGLRLAPFYDNPSYISIEIDQLLEAIHEPKGSIATKNTDEPSLCDYVMEWNRLGYDEIVKKWQSNVMKAKDQIFQLISSSFISEKRKKAFIALINRRIKELRCILKI